METKPVTIELRNKDAYRGNPNLELTPGDWTTTLSDQLVLNDGDSIYVKQSFIDTEASSSREIDIPEDITLHLEHAYYLNKFPDFTIDNDDYALEVKNGVASIDAGQLMLACEKYTSDTVPPGYGVIKQITWQIKNKKLIKPFTWSLGGIGLDGNIFHTEPKQIFNTIPSGNTLSVDVNIPYRIADEVAFTKYKGASNYEEQFDLGLQPPLVNVLKNETDFDLVKSVYLIIAAEISNRHFTLKQETTDIKLPAGNYDPTDLCTIINRELNKNAPPVNKNFVQTQFLKTSNKIEFPTPDATVFIDNSGIDAETDGVGIYQFIKTVVHNNAIKTVEELLYGASKVLLDFNVGQGLFSFTYMHTPFYYQGAEATGNNANTPFPNGYTINKSGGVIFTSLTATSDKFGNRVSFWDEQLGFNVDVTDPNSIVQSPTLYSDTITGIEVPRFNGLEDGKNITGNFTGADSLIKKSTSITTPEFLFTSNTTAPNTFNASTYTLPVLAQQPIFQQNTSFGYYLLEIDTNFESQFLDTTSTNKKIKSVVSRFFERASYTAGTSDGSLIYTHIGEPQILSSFSCRILTSDKVLATNVGVDNTIFLQLQRAVPAIQSPKSKDSRA
jgi:hypothetical protein